MNNNFWINKKVLLTGHTGFKGSWMTMYLKKLGAKISGISLDPPTNPNLFTLAHIQELCENSYICDIRDYDTLKKHIKKINPEIILHMAAQPLVRYGYENPIETMSVNVMGTCNVLDSVRYLNNLKVLVAVTTDKVYKNLEGNAHNFFEESALGGQCPYSASKASCEILVDCYRNSYANKLGISLSTPRAGNVIGGGDWSTDRLIPDAIRAWQGDESIVVRRPEAVRPWQHVLETIYAYTNLAEKMWSTPNLGGPYNFGPEDDGNLSVIELLTLAKKAYGKGQIQIDDQENGPYESSYLGLDINKAKTILKTEQRWKVEHSIEKTMQWYLWHSQGYDAFNLCNSDINEYLK